MKKGFVGAVIGAVLLLALAIPAFAAKYPPHPGAGSSSNSGGTTSTQGSSSTSNDANANDGSSQTGQYPPNVTPTTGSPSAELSSASVHPGDDVTVTGSDWGSDSGVDFTLHSSSPTPLGDSTVAGDGTFTATLQIPVTVQVGPHTLDITGQDQKGKDQTVSLDMSVLSVESATSESSGKSSSLSIGLIVLAAVIVISGAALMATRKKKGQHAGAGKAGK